VRSKPDNMRLDAPPSIVGSTERELAILMVLRELLDAALGRQDHARLGEYRQLVALAIDERQNIARGGVIE
jgi:hypothetical protein